MSLCVWQTLSMAAIVFIAIIDGLIALWASKAGHYRVLIAQRLPERRKGLLLGYARRLPFGYAIMTSSL